VHVINAIRTRLNSDEEGFTLIELLVVVIIIGILAAIAVPTFLNQRVKAGDSAAKADLRNAAIAMEASYTETGSYPNALADLQAQ
jgi:type IV pilus assembly protein PilA